MEHLSRAQYEALTDKDREYHIYEISVSNNKMLNEHDPVIRRILSYENAGRSTGKLFMRIFFLALGGVILVWLQNHFGK